MQIQNMFPADCIIDNTQIASGPGSTINNHNGAVINGGPGTNFNFSGPVTITVVYPDARRL
jgi:hypothetical protein